MKRAFTIRQMLLFIVAALVLPAFLLSLEFSWQQFRTDREQSNAHTLQVARDVMLDLDNKFNSIGAVAGALATSPSLRSADFAAFQAQAAAVLRLTGATNFVLTDRTGQQRVNTLKPHGTPLPMHGNPDLLKRVAASGRSQISNLYIGAVTQASVVSICVPIFIDGTLVYFLDIGVAGPYFDAALAHRKLPQEWVVALIDANGVIVARSHAAERFVGRKATPQLLGMLAHSAQGTAQLSTLEGIPVYTTFLRWPDNGWSVAIGIPRAGFDRTLWMALAQNLGAALVLMAIGAWLAGLGGRRVQHAMARLVAMSEALGRGAAPVPQALGLAEADFVANALGRTGERLARSELARAAAETALRGSNAALAQQVLEGSTELRQSRHLLSSIVEHMPAMVFLKDAAQLRYELFNRTGEELLGKPREALLGQTDRELYPAETAAARMASDQQVLASHQPVEIAQEEVLGRDGRRRYLHTRKIALLDADGRPTHLLGISVDITERVHAAEQLRIAAVAFDSQEPMMITNADSTILRVNRAFSASTGYGNDEILGRTPKLLQSGRHGADFYAAMWQSIAQTGAWQGECWDRRKNGEVYPAWTIISAIRDQDGKVCNYVWTQTDISERKRIEEEVRQLAFYDALTGLPNRRLLLERLRHAIDLCGRSGKIGALMFLDLDNFKTLNDTLGHDQGDLLLKQVACRLPRCVRSLDTVARLGGDEFVVMLEAMDDAPQEVARQASIVAQHILAELNQPFMLETRQHRCSASIGVTLMVDHQTSVEDLLKRADLAMYQAKADGRNTWRFFEQQMQTTINAQAEMEHEMHEALRLNCFELHFQAQVDGRQRVTGAEALLRWNHGKHGMVQPEQFIDLAERSGFILPLGRWVLGAACEQLALWARQPGMEQLTLAVNVSSRQFRQADFVAQICSALHTAGANPSLLKLELTESLMLDDFGDVVQKMDALKRLGVCFALDDFGTGYSSLSYLQQLPLDQLKIDRSFARAMFSGGNDGVIARIILLLGKALGLAIVAEGIETTEQHHFLVRHGCNAFQGFLFSPPLPAGSFAEFVQKGRADAD